MLQAGLTPDDWQAAILNSPSNHIILNCCRQAGKSTVTSFKILHHAISVAHALVLIFAPTERQSKELILKVKEAYRTLTGNAAYYSADDKLKIETIELTNGSRIIALPGNKEANVRGYSGCTLLVIDEASRVLDGLYYALRPMLAVSGGSEIILSTPFGKRGFFYQLWANRLTPQEGFAWDYYQIPASRITRISPEFLANEKRDLPELIYKQEYFNEFIEASDSVFNSDEINAMFDSEATPLFGTASSEYAA